MALETLNTQLETLNRRNSKKFNELTRSSSRIISAIPGLISMSSLFESAAKVSAGVCDEIGKSDVLMLDVWRPAADDGEILFLLFGVTDVDCVAFAFIENSVTVADAVSEVSRFTELLNDEPAIINV